MDMIVRTVAKGIVPFIWIYGAYIILHGHITPGGSFSGGVIVAAGAVLLIIAYGTKGAEKSLHEDNLHLLEALAGAVLVFLLLSEMFFRDYVTVLMGYFDIVSAGYVLLLNVAGGVMVLAALITIAYMFTRR
ncbi:MAG: hypothetical protein JW716_02290 [Candidatus Aenigmarchaeota archaeon]|nr:hypothetical protein [Candidatus Aenigmarchaeota archaeon]